MLGGFFQPKLFQSCGIHFLKITEGPGDKLNIILAHQVALGTQRFTHFAAQVSAINQLHFTLTLRRFLIGKYPDVGGNAGVVEHVRWQRDNAFQQVGFQNVASNFALTAARTTGKQWGTVKDNPDPPTIAHGAIHIVVVAHFADQVHQEQQRAVGNTRQSRAKATVKTFLRMFVVNLALNLLPVHTKRWVREHVVELIQRQLVVREGVAQLNTADVLTFDQHVGFTDSVGFRVQLLAKGTHDRVRVQFVHIFHA